MTRGCTCRLQLPPAVVVTIVWVSGRPAGREKTVIFSPAALLETVPESVTASPKMLSVREGVSETDREFGATETVPLNPEPGSV